MIVREGLKVEVISPSRFNQELFCCVARPTWLVQTGIQEPPGEMLQMEEKQCNH